MQETVNLKLKKIELADSPPDITVINHNWDKIDEEITNSSKQIEDLSKLKTSVPIAVLPQGSDILEMAKDTSLFPVLSTRTVRLFHSPTAPGNNQVNNDFIYTIYVTADPLYHRIIAQDIRSDKTYTILYSNGVHKGWKELATTETAELTLLNGWVNFDDTLGTPVCSVSGNIVSVYATIKNGIISNGTRILTLPLSMRPKSNRLIPAICQDNNFVFHNSYVIIGADGGISITDVQFYNTRTTLAFSFSI